MSETVVGIPPPRLGPPPPPTTTSLEIVAESLSMLRQSFFARWDIWLVAALFFTVTNVVDIVLRTPGHPFQSPMVIVSLVVRVAAYILVVAAALRAFTGRKSVWSVDLPLLRYVAAFVALLLVGVVLLAFMHSIPLILMRAYDPQASFAISLPLLFIWLFGFAVATLRIFPWIVALAVGDRSVGLSSAWRGMRGATLAGIGALIWTAPVLIVHLALTAEAKYLTGTPQLTLTVIDGLISVLEVMLNMAIAAVLYRFVAKYLPRK